MNSQDSQDKKFDSNKFTTGLVIGLLAGSTSYFLLNTDKGQELRENLKQKLADLEDEGLEFDQVKIGDLSLRQVVEVLINGHLKRPSGSKKRKKIIKTIKKKRATNKISQPKKFKGT